jgi:hypothetical protein
MQTIYSQSNKNITFFFAFLKVEITFKKQIIKSSGKLI